MLKARFSERANKEVVDAAVWYEEKSKGLGNEFLNEIQKVIDTIEKHPKRYHNTKDYYREALVKRFPYIIIYYFTPEILIIVSIFHASRDPKKKYR
jgi:plasmid stabilization system protein ParE